jgi:ABC-2 type transporter
MTATEVPPDLVIIKPRHGLSALDVKSVWQFRDLLLAFADRDIRLRYRQTFLGAAWVILQPLMGASIFSLVFGLIAKMPSHGVPYFLISYSGLLGWTLFFGTLTRISPSLIANSTLIRKIFFPRILIPLGVIPSVLLDFVVSLLVMLGMLVAYRITPNWTMPHRGKPCGEIPRHPALGAVPCPTADVRQPRGLLGRCRTSPARAVLLPSESAIGADRHIPHRFHQNRDASSGLPGLFSRHIRHRLVHRPGGVPQV